MGTTLRVASAQRGYTLTDRATFEQLVSRSIDLRIVAEGDPRLLNTYAVIVDADRLKNRAAAMAFGAWLSDGAGRDAIASFLIAGRPAFHAWPGDTTRTHPEDRPAAATSPVWR